MEITLIEARKRILYVKKADRFIPNCLTFIREAEDRMREKEEDRDEILGIVADIYLDLKSYLTHWVLDKHIASGALSKDEIRVVLDFLEEMICDHGDADFIASVNQETASIQKSQIRQICELGRTKELATIWGHDYCSGLSHSIRRGACFVTRNPAKINLFRQDHPVIWAEMVDEIKENHKGITLEQLISYLYLKVVAISMRDLYPIYEVTNSQYGFVCMQVNPRNWEDPKKMIEEVDFWYKELQIELGIADPNVVFKIPAVKAGLEATEVLVSKNYRLCITLNFSIRQHEAFTDLIKHGINHSFVVLMSGYLDDAVDKELVGLGIADSTVFSRHAAEAVIRKSYSNLRARRDSKTSILSAAIRGDWTIRNSLTAYTDSPMYFTTVTGRIENFDSKPRSLVPMVEDPIPQKILDVLERSIIFKQAYYNKLLDMDNVSEFIPLQNVLKTFLEAFDEIEASLQ